jgi:hypothetical protein
VCRDVVAGDSPARPGVVSRRFTPRGVLAAAGDGVAAGDAPAVALRRVGIAAWRGEIPAVTWEMWGELGEEWWVDADGETETGGQEKESWRGATARRERKGFPASRGNARARTWDVGWASDTGLLAFRWQR